MRGNSSSKRKRKDASYQRATLSNFFHTNKQASLKCPICEFFFPEDKLKSHASSCGLTFNAIASQASTQPRSSQSQKTSPPEYPSGAEDGDGDGDGDGEEALGLGINKMRFVVSPEEQYNSKNASLSPSKIVKEGEGKRDAFAVLLNSAVQHAQQAKQAKSVSFFRLDVVNGAFFPSFRHEEEPEEEQVRGSLISWSEEVTFRQIPSTLSLDSASQETRGDLKVMLATNIPSAQGPGTVEEGKEQEVPSGMQHFPVLKSMLQKSLRRREPERAVRLAVRMMCASLTDFLRRLPIICIEDVGLHPEFSCLVWLMVAVSKGYHPPLCLLEFCLTFVTDLAVAPGRDIYGPCAAQSAVHLAKDAQDPSVEEEEGSNSNSNSKGVSLLMLRSLPQGAKRTTLMALLIRASYGGMRWDVSMLETYARLWASRFLSPATSASAGGTADLDKLLLPAFKYTLHQSVLVSLMDKSVWGRRCVMAYSEVAASSQLKRDLNASIKGALQIRGGEDDGEFDNKDLLLKTLPLRLGDFVEQGVDFHCDNSLVPAITMAVRRAGSEAVNTLLQTAQALREADQTSATASTTHDEELGWLIKKCIWTFRSSTNNHRVWEGLSVECRAAADDVVKQDLGGKKIMATAWKLLAAPVSQHCALRCQVIAKSLGAIQ